MPLGQVAFYGCNNSSLCFSLCLGSLILQLMYLTEMDRQLARGVILFHYLHSLSAKQIKDQLDESDTSVKPSYSTIKYWVREFKNGRTNLTTAASPGRPAEVTNSVYRRCWQAR